MTLRLIVLAGSRSRYRNEPVSPSLDNAYENMGGRILQMCFRISGMLHEPKWNQRDTVCVYLFSRFFMLVSSWIVALGLHRQAPTLSPQTLLLSLPRRRWSIYTRLSDVDTQFPARVSPQFSSSEFKSERERGLGRESVLYISCPLDSFCNELQVISRSWSMIETTSGVSWTSGIKTAGSGSLKNQREWT